MKTTLILTAAILMIGVATWAYRVNYETRAAIERVNALHEAIAEERAQLAMLKAEWAYLNRPERLRALAEAHFDDLRLMPIDATHFGEVAEVPKPAGLLGEISGTVDVRGRVLGAE